MGKNALRCCMLAALKANIKCFECLITNGANINKGGYSFVLPAWAAVSISSLPTFQTEGTILEHPDPCEIVKLLEERGCRSCHSFSALKLAVLHGSVDVVSYLLNKYTYIINMEYVEKLFFCRYII